MKKSFIKLSFIYIYINLEVYGVSLGVHTWVLKSLRVTVQL